jgi:N-sulfoglucosamine sulfohydrolase
MRCPIVAAALINAIAVPSAWAQQSPAAAPIRPNIVWISNEDMSPHLGAYGDPLARTPVLDKLATEAIRYTNAFTTAPVCAPSRAAIITGMYQTTIGAQHMRTTEDRVPELPGPYLAVPPFYVKAFPEYLRAAGYYTTNRAKTDYQFGVPFTIWDDLGPNAHWRNRADKSQPFFSVFNFEVTHESQIFPTSPARKGKPLVTDSATVPVPPYYPDTPAIRQELARMYDNIADMDGQVGEILRQLDADGLVDNTIVFYWSDHGDGVPRSKRSLYDSGLRVPLMIRWPKMAAAVAGSANDQLVSMIDLAPTVLALAGVEIPGHLQGRALVGPKAGPAPEFVFAARDRMDIEYDMMRSARDDRFLYIRNFAPEQPYAGHIIYRNQSAIMQDWLRLQAEGALTGTAALWMRTHRPAEELYDTKADPHQVRNLAAEMAHRQTLERMRRTVADWMIRTGDQGLVNEPEMIHRMWPGGVQPETAQPYIVPRRELDAPSRRASIAIQSPIEVVIYVPTQGASIGYTTDEGASPKWRLYTGPILAKPGMTLRAKAIRYGYKESAETRVAFAQAGGTSAGQASPPRPSPAKAGPNVVLIQADDLGYGDLSAYGQARFSTPNLDRLAREGTRFTHYYAGSTVCAPSRTALMTGMHTGHAWIRGNGRLPEGDTPLRDEDVTVAEVLRAAGYRTAVIGKWGLGQPDSTGQPDRQGFEHAFGFLDHRHAHRQFTDHLWRNGQRVATDVHKDYVNGLFTADAKAFIERDDSRPFFLYLNYTVPHAELNAPLEDVNRFKSDFPEQPFENAVADAKLTGAHPHVATLGYRSQATPHAAFAAMITRMDRDIGQLVDAIRARGIERQTLVMFISDNGPHREGGGDPAYFKSSGGLRGIKRDLYEGGIRVPNIAWWPETIPAGRVSDHVWAHWDVLPTLAELAGAQAPPSIDGMSMTRALRGQPQPTHAFLYWEFHERGFQQAVRMGTWKAVRLKPEAPLELYDLQHDPSEERDVAAANPEVVKDIDAYLRTARTPSDRWPAK